MQQAADAVSVASLRPSQLQVQAAGGAGWTQIPRRWNTSTRRSYGRRRCAGRGRAVSSRVAGGAGRGHDGARCDKWRRTFKSGGVAGGRRYDISGGSCGVAGAGDAKRDGAASTRARARRCGVDGISLTVRPGWYFIHRPGLEYLKPLDREAAVRIRSRKAGTAVSPPFVTVAHWHSNGGRVRCRLREVDAAVPVCPRTQQYKIVKKIFF